MRGVTIVWMVVGHMSRILAVLLPFLQGFVCVTDSVRFRMDLLFMVSGFLTAHVYIANRGKLTLKGYGDFLRSRLIRLYPGYAAVLLLAVLMIGVAKGMEIKLTLNYSWADIPVNLAMLQAWPYLAAQVTPYNGGLWFVSALWFACLFAFPCAWILVHRLRKSWPTFLWVFLPAAVVFLFRQVASLGPFSSVTRAFCGFLCGSALFVLYANRSGFIVAAQKHLDRIVLVVLLLSLAFALPASSQAMGNAISFLLLVFVPLLVAGATAESSLTARLLTTKPLLWLGQVSYSLFLTQDLSIKILDHVLPADRFLNSSLPLRIALVVGWVLSILAFAVGFYYLIEAPCAAVLKRFARSGRRGAPRNEHPVSAGPTARAQ
jgi:peptidoglycan/LPS O-acetylase OafA/YrhL